jgi:hypothetical protein
MANGSATKPLSEKIRADLDAAPRIVWYQPLHLRTGAV